MFLALRWTEYGFIIVVAIIPIRVAPIKNGRAIWYGDKPALATIMFSVDFVRLYDVNNVPINTASGKNRGTYSNRRVHDSANAAMAVGFEGRRSTNVTAIIIPHITNSTNPTPEKNRRIRNLFKIFGLQRILYFIWKSIPWKIDNCKIKMNAYNFKTK